MTTLQNFDDISTFDKMQIPDKQMPFEESNTSEKKKNM